MTRMAGSGAGASLLLIGVLCGCTGAPSKPMTSPPAPEMAAEATSALQALRLFGAVQLAHFSANSRYAHPDALKSAGALDPAWPRVEAAAYRITCEVPPAGDRFLCHADALRDGLPWFRIDDSQKVRVDTARRPTAESPLAGRPQLGGVR